MGKQCSFCAFASDDVAAFGEHMRDVHQWDRLATARPAGVPGRALMLGFGGAILALAALSLLLWRAERSCRIQNNSAGWCGDVWFALFFGALPVAAFGFVVGVVLGVVLARRRTSPAK